MQLEGRALAVGGRWSVREGTWHPTDLGPRGMAHGWRVTGGMVAAYGSRYCAFVSGETQKRERLVSHLNVRVSLGVVWRHASETRLSTV